MARQFHLTITCINGSVQAVAKDYIAVDDLPGLVLINPMTTFGDIIYGGLGGAPARLGANSNSLNFFLASHNSGVPFWQQVQFTDLGAANALSSLDVGLTDSFVEYNVAGATNGRITTDRLLGFGLHALAEGRLTLTTGTPVTPTDVTGAGTIYWTPYNGNRICLYDGTRWKLYTFAEVSLALVITSGLNYDVFLYDNAGVLTLELSAAWASDSTRTDALALQDGIEVKSADKTRRYLGSIRASGTNATTDAKLNRLVFNHYNKVGRKLFFSDSTSHTYNTNALRQWNASASAQVGVLIGLQDSWFEMTAFVLRQNSAGVAAAAIGIGLNVTNANSADQPDNSSVPAANVTTSATARFAGYLSVGYNFLALLENGNGAAGTTTWQEGYLFGEVRC